MFPDTHRPSGEGAAADLVADAEFAARTLLDNNDREGECSIVCLCCGIETRYGYNGGGSVVVTGFHRETRYGYNGDGSVVVTGFHRGC